MDFFKLSAWFKPSVVLVVYLAVTIFSPTAQAATVSLFTDGFEGEPEFNAWTSVDTVKWDVINNAGGAHTGSKRAEVTGANDADDILRQTVSTTGYEAITLTYWYKANSLETGDEVFLEYTTDGSTWSTLLTFDDDLDDDTWHEQTHNLPAGASDNPIFSFRFRADLGQGNDFLKLDDVTVTGTDIEVVTPPTTGGIGGWKYKDLNENGARDGSEPGIADWTINLYQDEQLVATTTTEDNGEGTYFFSDLTAGTYLVCEDLPSNEHNWQQTDPTEAGGSSWRAEGRAECPNGTWGYETTLNANEEAYSFSFGNINGGLIGGWKYHDLNNNGQIDEDEPGLANWTINLYQDEQLIKNTQTEDNGKGTYFFLGLPAGTYKVCEVAGSGGWQQTDPTEAGGSTWRSPTRVFCENEGTWGFLDQVSLGHEEYSFDFGNNGGEIVPLDTEAPVTIITSPNPATEWENMIHITGTTTDNVGVASTTISTAIYDGESCGAYATTTTLNNTGGGAVFDWLFDWTPVDAGDYCIQANGLDTAGNIEHTATVFPIKFKKTATSTTPIPPTPPTDDNNNHEVSFGGGGGGGSTSGVGPSSLLALGNSNANTGVGGDTSGIGLVTNLGPSVPLANLDRGIDGGIITATETILLGLGTTTSTSTATSSVLTGSPLLAALGGLATGWWWLIILIIILAGLGGYWYWQKQEDNS